MSDETKLGRPTGPSDGREERPWDPETLRYKEKVALNYIAANPEQYRWIIAGHLKISLSKLSVLSCCEQGREYLCSVKSRPWDYFLPYKITWSAIDVSGNDLYGK